MVDRRHLLGAAGWLILPAHAATSRPLGVALVLRHAATELIHQMNIAALTERVVAMAKGVWLGMGASSSPVADFPK